MSNETEAKVTIQELMDHWDFMAGYWPRGNHVEPFMDFVVRDTLTYYLDRLSPTDRILDVAAGLGNCVYFPEGFDMQRVTNFDLSSEMLKLAKQRGYRCGNLVSGDANVHFPFVNQSFGLVICVYGMRYFYNHTQVISEMVRVAKPRGDIAIIDFSATFKYPFSVNVFEPVLLATQMRHLPISEAIPQTLYTHNNGKKYNIEMLRLKKR